ncbi:MAG: formyl transferase [Gammaproteobacteria bacterium]|nr:formyl transferase [Gammaproteobacteria bacterium]
MRFLYLGKQDVLTSYLETFGEVVQTEEPVNEMTHGTFDFVISYRYLHILRPNFLNVYPKKVINLHISYLPWNRGKDPNLWSWIENTVKGVTIHYMDAGLDTGPIIYQEKVALDPEGTLASTYQQLSIAIEALFMKKWPEILAEKCPCIPQTTMGSAHKLKDRQKVAYLLHAGWETRVSQLQQPEKAKESTV